MPYLLSEWRAHIQEVWGEYQAAKFAVLRLHEQVNADANIVAGEHGVREYLSSADTNLEGTYTIRIFAAFEAALRSYDRYHFDDPERETKAATMINQLGALNHIRVRIPIRDGVHCVRRIRNFWAHDSDDEPNPIPINRVRDSLIAQADLAFEVACRKVIDRARQSKTEIVIWRDGQIVELSPEEATAELEANLAKRKSNIPSNTK